MTCVYLTVACGIVVGVLMWAPSTRPYMMAIVGGIRTLVACLAFTLLLVISSVAIYFDVEYRWLGREAEATVTKAELDSKSVRVEYRFTDADGTPRTGKALASAGWDVPPGGTITIQYLPGPEGSSRLSEPRSSAQWMPYAVFVGSGLLLLLTIGLAVRRVMMAAAPPL
jgi:hypothetical protein